MTRSRLVPLLLGLPLLACSNGSDTAGAAPSESPSASGSAPASGADSAENLERLRANASETAARAEVQVERMKVAHILIAFQGASRSTVARSKEEAEQRTADLLARIEAGEDFLELMRESSDDPGPGIYGMTTGAPSGEYYQRSGMAGAFGDVGWRLDVGQVGVAAHDATSSPFGWHIIKRLEDEPVPAPLPPPEFDSTPEERLEVLRTNVSTTAARAELELETMKVAHILVAFQGATRSRATRSKEEAEQRAADLLAQIEDGVDFLELMRASSDDPGPGVYGMTTGAPSGDYFPRSQMAGAFGDVGWRLEVDQVGVAAHDPTSSPFGWHIIKRVE